MMIDATAIQNARKDEAFGESCWITFYLRGAPEQLAAMSGGLKALHAENLDSGDSGCLYAKLPVSLELYEIESRVAMVRDLAAEAGVEIDIIDLDSSPHARASRFYTLWTAPAG